MSCHYHSNILIIILKSQGNIYIFNMLSASVQNNPPPLDIFQYTPILVKVSKYRCMYNVHIISKN